MNYYRRYPGDYMRDTAHLSLPEHGAYTLLLDHQYSTEQPIPADLDSIYRLCRAMTPEDQAAVRSVVDRFFPLNCSGRLNPRASRQIPTERARIDAARENGLKGGRPITKNKPAGLRVGLAEQNPEPKLPSPSPSFTPETRKPTPVPPKEETKDTRKEKTPDAASGAVQKVNGSAVWDAYKKAFSERYGTPPTRNAKVNGQISAFAKRLPEDEAAPVAAYFVTHSNAYYVQRGHSVDCLLRDAEKLRMEWATGRKVTQSQARLGDRTAGNAVVELLRERGEL